MVMAPTNWTSVVATLTADTAAVATNLAPGLHISPAVEAVITSLAGLLTLAHIHVPAILNAITTPTPPSQVGAQQTGNVGAQQTGNVGGTQLDAFLGDLLHAIGVEPGGKGS
jgi:hypothetical protein